VVLFGLLPCQPATQSRQKSVRRPPIFGIGLYVPVVSDRLLMQLLMPPVMSALVLLMGWNAMRSTSPYGILTAGRVRLLWGGFFGMLIFLYGVTFNRELTAVWIENPFALVGIVALILSLGVWGGLKWWRSSHTAPTQADQIGTTVHGDPSRLGSPLDGPQHPSTSLRVRSWAVLIWALLGIGGTLAAILWKVVRR
jgi:hypothetical protein